MFWLNKWVVTKEIQNNLFSESLAFKQKEDAVQRGKIKHRNEPKPPEADQSIIDRVLKDL